MPWYVALLEEIAFSEKNNFLNACVGSNFLSVKCNF